MARYKYQGHVRDGNGTVIQSATISVYETGGTTAASIYTASSGGTAVNSVTSDDNGYYYFYVDDSDYTTDQEFRITISKSDYESKSYDNVNVFILGIDASSIITATSTNTLTNKTLTAPVIADFTNATHNHQNDAGGGALEAAAIPNLAASKITSGALTHERGGLEADVSGYSSSLVKIDGGSTSAVTVTSQAESLLDDATALAMRGTIGVSNLGFCRGINLTYKDADELYFGEGVLEINGSLYTLTNSGAVTAMNLVTAATSLVTDTWYFIGFSVPGAGTALSSSDLVITSTAPTYNETKRGWYTAGGARIIDRVWTSDTDTIDPTSLWTGIRYSHESKTILDDTTPATSATAIDAGSPDWGVSVWAGGWGELTDDASASAQKIYNGAQENIYQYETTASGHYIVTPWAGATNASNQIYYAGESLTYTIFRIRSTFDDLPAGVR